MHLVLPALDLSFLDVDFSVSLSSLGTNQFKKKLIGTWLGQDLGFFGTRGLRLGLDNTLFTVDC